MFSGFFFSSGVGEREGAKWKDFSMEEFIMGQENFREEKRWIFQH